MNAFTIVIVLMAALALLALIFSFIAVRGKNGPWGLFSALFSLGAGVLFAIWLGKTNSSLLGNFTQEEGILGTVADFAFHSRDDRSCAFCALQRYRRIYKAVDEGRQAE